MVMLRGLPRFWTSTNGYQSSAIPLDIGRRMLFKRLTGNRYSTKSVCSFSRRHLAAKLFFQAPISIKIQKDYG